MLLSCNHAIPNQALNGDQSLHTLHIGQITTPFQASRRSTLPIAGESGLGIELLTSLSQMRFHIRRCCCGLVIGRHGLVLASGPAQSLAGIRCVLLLPRRRRTGLVCMWPARVLGSSRTYGVGAAGRAGKWSRPKFREAGEGRGHVFYGPRTVCKSV